MAVSIVGSQATITIDPGDSTLHATLPADYQDGDLLVAHVSRYGSAPDEEIPAGWTSLGTSENIYGNGLICWRMASDEPDYYVFYCGVYGGVVVITAFRGTSQSAPINASNYLAQSLTCQAVTSTVDNCLIWRWGWSTLYNRTYTFAAGTTEVWDVDNGVSSVASSSEAAGYASQAAAGDTGTCVITPSRYTALNALGAATVAIAPFVPIPYRAFAVIVG